MQAIARMVNGRVRGPGYRKFRWREITGMTGDHVVMPAEREAGEPVARVTSLTVVHVILGTGYFAYREIPA
jgi:hypothetical protein